MNTSKNLQKSQQQEEKSGNATTVKKQSQFAITQTRVS